MLTRVLGGRSGLWVGNEVGGGALGEQEGMARAVADETIVEAQ